MQNTQMHANEIKSARTAKITMIAATVLYFVALLAFSLWFTLQ